MLYVTIVPTEINDVDENELNKKIKINITFKIIKIVKL